MKVVLIGYMASGKTAVGTVLAEELGARFIDLDAYIVQHKGKSIGQIFEEEGEFAFRQLEGEMLKKVLQEPKPMVLSTGGGTPCYGHNMNEILKNSAHSVYLKVPVPVLVERIEKAKAQRPMVREIVHEDLLGFVERHLFERSAFYEMAKHTIAGENKTIEGVVEEIKALLG